MGPCDAATAGAKAAHGSLQSNPRACLQKQQPGHLLGASVVILPTSSPVVNGLSPSFRRSLDPSLRSSPCV